MKRFADFSEEEVLEGNKIRIDNILNNEVKITGYSIKTSRYSKNESGKYLTLQVEIDQEKFVIFTGSDVLINQMDKYGEEVPFVATVRKIKNYFSLT